jgi:hypothetical protein
MQERREGYKGSRYKGDPDAREDLDLRVGRREADVVLSRAGGCGRRAALDTENSPDL